VRGGLPPNAESGAAGRTLERVEVERPDRFAFDLQHGDELRQGLPPIVGSDGGSTWFAGGGHVAVPQFPLHSAGEFFLGFDLQPDNSDPQVLLGAVWARSALLVEVNVPHARSLSISIRDETDHQLVARAELSPAAARRLVITGDLLSAAISVHEIQPWARQPGSALDVEVVVTEPPAAWPPSQAGFAMSGSLVDGLHQPGYVGRIAEVYLGDHALEASRPAALVSASDNPTGLTYGRLATPFPELLGRFRRDIRRLREWAAASHSTAGDLDDASLILYRWLFDQHPLLVDLAGSLGVQLWLPGMSERERRYMDVVLDDRPTLQMTGVLGPESAFGFEWEPVEQWRSNPAFHTNGHAVSHEAFIRFVRNKLGGGHFDEHDRTRWQRDLIGFTEGLRVMGQDALLYQLRAIADAVLLGVAASRVEALAG
jgi:hypothetical protein